MMVSKKKYNEAVDSANAAITGLHRDIDSLVQANADLSAQLRRLTEAVAAVDASLKVKDLRDAVQDLQDTADLIGG